MLWFIVFILKFEELVIKIDEGLVDVVSVKPNPNSNFLIYVWQLDDCNIL